MCVLRMCVLRLQVHCDEQILFPASYAETAAWLRKTAISNEGTLRQCISQLQALLSAHAHLQTLTSGVEVPAQKLPTMTSSGSFIK